MDLKVFCGRSNIPLVAAMREQLGVALPCVAESFSDGEPKVEFLENVRGADVFLVQSLNQRLVQVGHRVGDPIGSNLDELFAMVNAAKLASARSVTAVIPYLGYARQDRKVKPRTSITAQAICIALEAVGVGRILTTDLHAGQIQGFFRGPFDNLEALPLLLRAIRTDLNLTHFDDVAFVSPDDGGLDRCRETGKLVRCDRVTFVMKQRDHDGEVHTYGVRDPDLVRGRICLLIDDLVDTGGTLVKAAEALQQAGAERIFAACVHPVLSADVHSGQSAMARIVASPIERLYITDTLPIAGRLTTDAEIARVRVVSVAPLFSDAIREIHRQGSVSSIFRKTCEGIFKD